MKSILQLEKECYICRNIFCISNRTGLEEHHVIFGTANRKLSEKYGLKVWLCYDHHRTGKLAVHMDKDTDIYLKSEAQREFEKTHTHDEWMQLFGRNYL